MKIIHCIRGLANSSGTTHIVGPLAEAQARLGNEVSVFYVSKPDQQAVVPDSALVESREFPMSWPTRHLGWSRSYRAALRETVGSYDVVHIHAIWNYPTWMAMKEAKRAGVPYMVAPQGSLEAWALGRSAKLKRLYGVLGERRFYDDASAMQALTENEAAQCRAFGIAAPCEILPNGVDLAGIDAATVKGRGLNERLGLDSEAKVLLFLGRVFPKKGLDVLIPAFAEVARNLPDWHLVVAGDDSGTGYRKVMEDVASASEGAERIHFIGEVRGDDKFAALKSAQAFALTSYSEGLPVAVVEAMACGLPVLVTPGCNVPEVAEADAGWVCNADQKAVAETLKQMLSSGGELESRGEKARCLVEAKFTWPIIAERSIEIYDLIRARPKLPHQPQK